GLSILHLNKMRPHGSASRRNRRSVGETEKPLRPVMKARAMGSAVATAVGSGLRAGGQLGPGSSGADARLLSGHEALGSGGLELLANLHSVVARCEPADLGRVHRRLVGRFTLADLRLTSTEQFGVLRLRASQ